MQTSIDLNAYVNNKCEGRQQINVTQPEPKNTPSQSRREKGFTLDIHAIISMRSGFKGKGSCRMERKFHPCSRFFVCRYLQ